MITRQWPAGIIFSLARATSWSAVVLISGLAFSSCGQREEPALADARTALGQAAELAAAFSFFESERLIRPVLSELEVGSADWQEAVYLLAASLRHQTPASKHKQDEAKHLLTDLLEVSPQSALAPDALLELGRMSELKHVPGEMPDEAAARAYYGRILEEYPKCELAEVAVLRLGQSYVGDGRNSEFVARGVAVLEEWMRKHPKSPGRGLLAAFLGNVFQHVCNDRERGLSALIEADRNTILPMARRSDEWWRIARLAEGTGRLDVAVEYYQKIAAEGFRNLHGSDARKRLEALRMAHPELEIIVPDEQSLLPFQTESDRS